MKVNESAESWTDSVGDIMAQNARGGQSQKVSRNYLSIMRTVTAPRGRRGRGLLSDKGAVLRRIFRRFNRGGQRAGRVSNRNPKEKRLQEESWDLVIL